MGLKRHFHVQLMAPGSVDNTAPESKGHGVMFSVYIWEASSIAEVSLLEIIFFHPTQD